MNMQTGPAQIVKGDVTSTVEEYLDRLQWFAETVMPVVALVKYITLPSGLNARALATLKFGTIGTSRSPSRRNRARGSRAVSVAVTFAIL